MSFAHRIGVLHDHPVAIHVAETWLAEEDLLGNLSALDDLQFRMFEFIAPVDPEATLAAIERELARPGSELVVDTFQSHTHQVASIARKLARFEALVPRVVAVLMQFAIAGRATSNNDKPRDLLTSMFQIQWSGVRSSLHQRLELIRPMLRSEESAERNLALAYLEQAISVARLPNHIDEAFGARGQAIVQELSTWAEMNDWYRTVLNELTPLLDDPSFADAVKLVLGRQFSGLWRHSGCQDELEAVFKHVADKGFWREGWLAAADCLGRRSGKSKPEIRERLASLVNYLEPQEVEDKVRALLGASPGRAFEALQPENGAKGGSFWTEGNDFVAGLTSRLI